GLGGFAVVLLLHRPGQEHQLGFRAGRPTPGSGCAGVVFRPGHGGLSRGGLPPDPPGPAEALPGARAGSEGPTPGGYSSTGNVVGGEEAGSFPRTRGAAALVTATTSAAGSPPALRWRKRTPQGMGS